MKELNYKIYVLKIINNEEILVYPFVYNFQLRFCSK